MIKLLRLRRKEDTVSFAVQFSNSKAVNRDRMTGLIEANSGRGFLRLPRNAIERMIAAYPGLRHSAPAASGETKDRYALFDTSLKNGEFYGEDYTFCDRWRAIDGKIWVDKDIALRHVGTTT